jgi:TPR repeat protein
MVNSNISELLKKARHEIDCGECKTALGILMPLIKGKNPEALFLYSMFSVSGEETDEEFEQRSISLLKESSDLGYAPAMYALAVCYKFGDLVPKDVSRSQALFKKSADAGYARAKLEHGLNLVYGTEKIEQNEKLGISLIKEAADEGLEEAIDTLQQLTKSGTDPN